MFADTEDAVRRSRREERTRLGHILDDRRHLAEHLHRLVAVGSGSERAELVLALRITGVVTHVLCPADVAGSGQRAETLARRVRDVRHPCMERRPLGVARKAVLDADVLEVLELAVEARQLETQLAVACRWVGVDDRVRYCQLYWRRRRHKVYGERHVVADLAGLVHGEEI